MTARPFSAFLLALLVAGLLVPVVARKKDNAEKPAAPPAPAAVAPAPVKPAEPPVPALALVPAPKLSSTLTIDGDLTEWGGAAVIPVRSASCVIKQQSTHPFKGPAREGAEFRVAWTAQGLAVSATVLDSHLVVSDDEAGFSWDCIELFLDMRPLPELGTEPYTRGAYQLVVRPAIGTKPVRTYFNPRDGRIDGVQAASKTVPGSYTIEMLIPWHQGFAARKGGRLGFQCSFDDADPTDSGASQPLDMACRGGQDLWKLPQNFVQMQLVDSLRFGPAVNLGALVEVDLPSVVTRPGKRSFVVDFSGELARRAAIVDIAFVDNAGATRAAGRSVVTGPFVAGWPQSGCAVLTINPGALPDGRYVANLTLRSADSSVLGSCVVSTRVLAAAVDGTEKRIAAAKPGTLSSRSPMAGLAWLGAAAAFERVKHYLGLANSDPMAEVAVEADARLSLLEGKKPAAGGLLDLLALTTAAPGEVKVEFAPENRYADVSLYWGGMPLAGAVIRSFASAQAAADSLRTMNGHDIPGLFRDTVVNGLKGAVCDRGPVSEGFRLAAFDPSHHLASVSFGYRFATVYDTADLALATPPEVVILPGCLEALKTRLTAWAKANRKTIAGLDSVKQPIFVVAGDIAAPGVKARFDSLTEVTLARVVAQAPALRVAQADRVVSCQSPVPAVAGRVLSLIAAGKAVSLTEVDTVRQLLVAALAPKGLKPAAAPAAKRLFVGDVHMHSFYSDGMPSPEGLLLEAMYMNMDFAVSTDHNTMRGALRVGTALKRHGFAFPLVVGEEVTTDSLHMNVYPVTRLISQTIPRDSIVSQAHRQGAAIQLNHPGYPASAWVRPVLDSGLAGTGYDAWEHVPPAYDRFRAEGRVPHLTGSTDTHDGLFWDLERTVVLAPAFSGAELAKAVKQGRTLIVSPYSAHYLYGPDSLTSVVWAALAEGKALRLQKEAAVKQMLAKADLGGLVKGSRGE